METSEIPIYCSRLLNSTATDSQTREMWHKIGCNINYWPMDQAADVTCDSPELTYSSNIASLYKHILDNHTEAIIMEYNTVPVIDNIQQLYSAIEKGKQEFPEADIMLLDSQQSASIPHKEKPTSREIIGKDTPTLLKPPVRQIPSVTSIRSESKTFSVYTTLKQPFTVPHLFYITERGVKALLGPSEPILNTPVKHAQQIVRQAAKLNLVITSMPFCRPLLEASNKVER